jgi:hypothetical protein
MYSAVSAQQLSSVGHTSHPLSSVGTPVILVYRRWGGVLIMCPPTKRPCDNSTQAQLTHRLPQGSANKRFMFAGDGLGH